MKYRYTKKQMMDFIDRAEDTQMLEIAEEYIDLHVDKTFAKSAYDELIDLIRRTRNTMWLADMDYACSRSERQRRAN